MNQEMRALIKNVDPEILEVLTKLAKAMLDDQKAQEAVKYKTLLISPAEAADIIAKDGGPTVLTVSFGLDALRYYNAKGIMSDDSRMLWAVGCLLEAGRIIGIRQERARMRARNEAGH